MTRNLPFALCLAVMLVGSVPAVGEFLLDFDDLGLADNDKIPQTYGDNSLFTVAYRELDSFGNGPVAASNLSFWTNGYGDLTRVVWGSDQIASRVAEIRLDSLTAAPIVLNSFQAADWDGSANSQTFRIYDGNYNQLFEVANFDVTDIGRDTFSPSISSNTIILQWDYPWAVAVDNISITAVPEPSSLALLAACSGLYAVHKRGRSLGRLFIAKTDSI